MIAQAFADFMSHDVGVLPIGFLFMVVVYVIYGAIRNMISNELEIVSTGERAYIKVHFKKYPITNTDIPGIIECGPGKIVVTTLKNRQLMHSTGFDGSGMSFVQINGKLYVNDVDIMQLMEELR